MTAAGVPRPVGGERWLAGTAMLAIASMAVLVRAFLAVKLCFLALFLLAFIVDAGLRRRRIVVYRRLVWFYAWIGCAGVVWAVVGLLHPANYVEGVFDALRLYVVWSGVFVGLFTMLRAGRSLQPMHVAMVAAGILIPVINLVGLCDLFYGTHFIPAAVRQELFLEIGFGDGYLQFASVNVSTMFLVVPYLLALQFRRDSNGSNNLPAKVALLLSLILAALSGRRALWIVIAVTPFTIVLLALLTDGHQFMKPGAKRLLAAWLVATVIGFGALVFRPSGNETDVGAINRFTQAFSSEDERTIQRPYLIEGFTASPWFGSGFGGNAGYNRNEEKPWTYELTYHTMLFNMGVVGTALLVTLFSVYFLFVLRLLRRFQEGSAIPFALLVGFVSILIGAYSNPYLSGFDSLFFVGLLPYLSTFHQGFERPPSAAQVGP